MQPLIARRSAPDPAPSRLSYRAQRLWLTPLFRKMLRLGVPTFVVLMIFGSLIADPAVRQQVVDTAHEMRREIEDRPEFRLNVMGISGASAMVTEDVRQAMALDLPQSSFDVDLEDLRERVEALPAVKTADLRIEAGGYLAVVIEERVPALIWQTRDGPMLIDADGYFVAALSQRPDVVGLPAVAGDAADTAVDEALMLFAIARPLGPDLRGLVRMGARRWDVALTDDRRILLPEDNPAVALERALALHDVNDLLNRGVRQVDLRNPDRLTVQMTPEALAEYRRMQNPDTQDPSGEQSG